MVICAAPLHECGFQVLLVLTYCSVKGHRTFFFLSFFLKARVSHIHIFVVCPLAGHTDSLFTSGYFCSSSSFLFSVFKIQLFVYALLSVFASTSHSLYSRLTRLHRGVDLHISLPPLTCSTIFIAHSQTVHGNELSASLRHSQCGRRAAPLSCSVSVLIFTFGGRDSAILYFFALGALGNLMQISKQTNIYQILCRKSQTYMLVFASYE